MIVALYSIAGAAFYMRLMKKTGLLAVSAGLVLLLTGCRSQFDVILQSNDTDVKFKGGLEYYNSGKFRKAAAIFESMLLVSQGTPQEDSVHYYNAMSNYRYGDYITAEANFAKFLEIFPRSPFSEESKFLRIKCLYEGTYRWELDQVPTKKAMAIIGEFMYENPDSQYYPICKAMLDEFQERLDRKDYEAAKLYYNMEDFQASRYALKCVLKDNSENRYREQILYYTALSSYKFADLSIPEKRKERFMTFIDDYYNFVGEYPSVKERKELDNYFAKANKVVGMKVELDSAQIAAVREMAEAEGVAGRAGTKISADRKGTKKAIKAAKKAVADAENENEVARRIASELKTTDKKSAKQKAKQERAEALRLYKEAKARKDAGKSNKK